MSQSVGLARTLRGALVAALDLACYGGAGAALAALGWALLDPLHAPSANPVSPGSDAARAGAFASPLSLASAALNQDPFARGGTASPGGQSAEGYKLFATRVSPEGASSAILSGPDLPQGAYTIGETLPGGGRLANVTRDYVEIERGGDRLTVQFSAPPALNILPPRPAAPQSSVASQASALPGLRPVENNGRLIGLEVGDGAPGVLAAAGLRPGDLIVGVNGLSATPDELQRQQAALLNGADVTIQYERGGETLTARLGGMRK